MNNGKTKLYVAGGFCLLAFVVDRVILSDSGPARAEASLVADVAGSDAATPMVGQPIPHIAFPPVSKPADRKPPRDFFARADGEGTDGTSGVTSRAAVGGRLLRQAFQEAATLGGVLLTADGGIAFVNGTKMSPGDSILGCELKNVFGRSVTFQCSDGTAMLVIAPRSLKRLN